MFRTLTSDKPATPVTPSPAPTPQQPPQPAAAGGFTQMFQALTGTEYGQIYDHFSVVYEYANGAKLFSNCRQQPGCKNDISGQVNQAVHSSVR